MKNRPAISPFLATIMLVVITLAVGGTLYTEFGQMMVSQMKTPSCQLQDTTVSPDGRTITLTIKNDGNVRLALQEVTVTYGTAMNTFWFGLAQGNPVLLVTNANVALTANDAIGNPPYPEAIQYVAARAGLSYDQVASLTRADMTLGQLLCAAGSCDGTIVSSPSGGTMLLPGQVLAASIKTRFSVSPFSTFTLTVVTDQISRAFNVQA